ncbi:hypothetical protein F5B22DRAFT_597930 [Xylaria bambusicola]|uniref:uncharacterized protein n=1 Tax=Xylaria bambusicola TaxID=326684 RepID=UPI0020082716|nr:uncharacterized protein F5B22DRAFT_597930 [Xylaria bambusicola]KAI0521158.1 hypothetical protein F5B22DRAFT_597930 [Xylaria bambusicola]
MAPNFRQNTQTRRGNRGGYVEQDDFDGLPIRQYRREWVTIAPPPPPDLTRVNDIWATELPYGMPKDAPLLPTHTQELLMAARSGRLWKRPAPVEEEEVEADPTLTEKNDKKEDDPSTKGFQVKVWKQVPRNAEGPYVSYLGKRRKGTITLSSDLPAGAAPGPTITKATVRRIDAAGNPYTQEVTLNEGQHVDGEIISTTVVAAPVPTVAVEAAATPVRRRPPPPKRKPKGPGRGRKKKLPLTPSTHHNAVKPVTTGVIPGVPPVDGAQVLKTDDETSKNNDIEMADDDDGDDVEDGEDEGEVDDDDEDGDGDTGFVSRADSETKSDQMEISPSQDLAEKAAGSTQVPPTQEVPSWTNATLSAPLPPLSHVEGSPLKHVISAQSPGSHHPDSPSQDDMPKTAAAVDEVEQACFKFEPGLSLPPAMDASTVNESTETAVMTPIDAQVKPDPDIDMEDAAPLPIDVPPEVAPSAAETLENPQDTMDSLPIEPTDSSEPIPSEIPVNEGLQTEITSVAPSLETESREAEVASSGDVSTSNDATNEVQAAVPIAQEITEPSVEPSVPEPTDVPPIDEQPISAPDLGQFLDEPAEPEENAANSPDLFSGLEAALNQHESGSSEPEPVPEKSEAAVPVDATQAAGSPTQTSS